MTEGRQDLETQLARGAWSIKYVIAQLDVDGS